MQYLFLILISILPFSINAQKDIQEPFTGIVVYEEKWEYSLEGQQFLDSIVHRRLELSPESILDDYIHEMGPQEFKELMLMFCKTANTIHTMKVTEDSVFTQQVFAIKEFNDDYPHLPAFSSVRKHVMKQTLLNNFSDSVYSYNVHVDKKQDILGYKCHRVNTMSLTPGQSNKGFLETGTGTHVVEMWVTTEIPLETNLIDYDANNYNLGFPLKYKYYHTSFPGLYLTIEVIKVLQDTKK